MNLFNIGTDLVKKGYQVTVITGFPNHPYGKIYDGYKMKIYSRESVNGIDIFRIPLFPDHSLSPIKRAVNFISFSLSAVFIGFFLIQKIKIDMILTYMPPLTIGIPTFLFRRLHNVPVAYYVSDLWPENLLASGAYIPKFLVKCIRVFEDWVYNQSDIICVNSPGYISNLIGKGVLPRKIQLISDSVDSELFYPVKYDEHLAKKYGIENKFNIIYGGNIGKVQALEVFISVANKLRDFENLQIVFIGDGTELGKLKRLVNKLSLDNVTFISRKPIEEISKYFGLADILFLHLNSHPAFKNQFPSKISAYMACSKPILCAVDGTAAKVIKESNAGLTCEPCNEREIIKAIKQFIQMDKTEHKLMSKNGRKMYEKNFTREIQSNNFDEVIRKLIERAK
tara:strand:- start:542 stop:1729 length:1188 start_codon:yes stop_codon:yes gene_type:complete